MHRLLVLGGLSLHGPDGPVTGRASQRHRRALLALLATEHPRSLTRERLIAYLWPESGSEHGRQLLRQALYQLRGALGEDALLSHGEEVGLNPQRLGCDLWTVREALERGDLEQAVAAYTGPFLDGVFVSGAEEFERWVKTERSRLALGHAEALELLAREREAVGDLSGAAGSWRRLAVHDPYSSHVARHLIEALEAAGDRAGALRHATVHAALLQAELGLESDPEVEALAARLRQPPDRREAGAGGPARPVETTSEVGTGEATSLAPAPHRVAAVPATPELASTPDSGVPGIAPGPLTVPARVRPFVLGSLLLLGVLGVLLPAETGQRTLALLGVGPGESLLGRGVLAEREPILLADFASPTGDTMLARMATVAFRIDLAQSPVLTLVEPQRVQAALDRMERSGAALLNAELAREVAQREGVKAVLAGEIAGSDSGYLLSAQLLSAETGEILVAHRETARDSAAMLPALDRLSKQLRRRIGEPLRSLRSNRPLAQVTTSSLEALRKYSQALHIDAREGDWGTLISLLEEATALDSSFAMAQLALAIAYHDLFGRSAPQARMLEHAYRHRDRLTARERYLLLGNYHLFHTWEPEKAVSALRALVETDPRDRRALHGLSLSYWRLGDYARAEEYARRSVAGDSGRAVSWLILGDWQFNQGKIEEAEKTFRQAADRFPGSLYVAYRTIHFRAAHGDYAAAERHAREGRRARPENLDWQENAARLLADLAAVRGRLREAERLAAEVSEFGGRQGRPAAGLTEALHLAHLEVTLGRSEARALDRAERVLAKLPFAELDVYDRPYRDLAALHAPIGETEAARALLTEW